MPRPPDPPAFAEAGKSGDVPGMTRGDGQRRPVMAEEVRPAARAQSGAQTAPAQTRARARAQARAIRAKQGPARLRGERNATEERHAGYGRTATAPEAQRTMTKHDISGGGHDKT